MSELDEVITAEEAFKLFVISVRGIQKACERATAKGHTWCRKSGGTWLILKSTCAAHWERRELTDEEVELALEDMDLMNAPPTWILDDE